MSTVIQRLPALGVGSGDAHTLTGCVAGSRITVSVLHSYLSTVVSLAITNTTGLTKHVTDEYDAGVAIMHAWSAEVSANGSCVITPTFSTGIIRVFFASEVAGINHTTPFSDVNSHHNASSSDLSCGVLTPTTDGSYVQFLGYNVGGGAVTPPSGFTEVLDSAGWYLADFVQGAAAAITPIATLGGAAESEGFGVVFRAAAGGAVAKSVLPFFLTNGS